MPTGYYKRSKKQIEKAKRNLVRNYWIGKKMSKEHRAKMKKNSKGMLGKHHSLDTRKEMSRTRKGRKATKETIQKMIKSAKRGEENSQWKGGISFQPYSLDWTQTLKRSIRERDNYVCFICKILQGDRAFDVHHIDYDKKNCNPSNLITLCHRCHMKTNTGRDYWTNYFNNSGK